MKFCSKCGKEIMDQAVICVHCGCAISDAPNNPIQNQPIAPLNNPSESGGLAIAAIIVALLSPLIGFILGIIGYNKYKTPAYKGQCAGAMFLSIFVFIISFIILMSF